MGHKNSTPYFSNDVGINRDDSYLYNTISLRYQARLKILLNRYNVFYPSHSAPEAKHTERRQWRQRLRQVIIRGGLQDFLF